MLLTAIRTDNLNKQSVQLLNQSSKCKALSKQTIFVVFKKNTFICSFNFSYFVLFSILLSYSAIFFFAIGSVDCFECCNTEVVEKSTS